MVEVIKIKKGSVILVETPTPLPDRAEEEVRAKLSEAFGDHTIVFPNGTKFTIIETE